MQPGERVTLIKKSAQALAPQDWSDVDLILDQFGFPTESEWSGDPYSYVVNQLKGGKDDALAELHAYLHPGAVPPTKPQPETIDDPDSPWETGGFRLFVTHVSAQKENVAKLKDALAEHSIEAFVAHEAIEPTKEWLEVIESALRSCDGLGAWLTAGFKESNWCDQEVGFAVDRGVVVVPLRFGLDPYGFIGKFQALTVRDKHPTPDIARTIAELLMRHELSRGAMARAIVWRFENSDSFNAARANLGYLRRIPPEAWTQALKEQARTAHERNYQNKEALSGERKVSEVVTELLDEYDARSSKQS